MSKTVTITMTAGATLAKGTPVYISPELDVKALVGTNSGSFGVLINGSVSGSACAVAISGPVKVKCSDATVVKGSKVLFNVAGTAALVSGSNTVSGQAMEAGYAADADGEAGLILINLFDKKDNA